MQIWMKILLGTATIAVLIAFGVLMATGGTHANDVVNRVRFSCGDDAANRFLAAYHNESGGIYLRERADAWAARCADQGVDPQVRP